MGADEIRQGRRSGRERDAGVREGGRRGAGTPSRGQPVRLRIWTLGQFRVERDDQPILSGEWRRGAASAVLKLLLVHPRLSRGRAAELLFPDVAAESVATRLNDALHTLRRALEPGLQRGSPSRYIVSDGPQLMLRLGEADWLDFQAFDRLLSAAGSAADPLPLLRQATGLYGGDLFEEESYTWCEPVREHLRERWKQAMFALAEVEEQRGQLGAAILTLKRLIAAERTLEPAVRQLMLIHQRRGSVGEAMTAYSQLKQALRRDIGVVPSRETRALAESMLGGGTPTP